MEEDQHWESSKSPQKKTKLAEIKKKKRVRFLLPHQTERKRRPSSPRDADQEMFTCECCYCQKDVGNMSGVSMGTGTMTEAASHSPSCEKLILDLSNLSLNPDTTQPTLAQEIQKREKNKTHWQQKSKKVFQRLLHEWTE
ncbi:protein FAM156A/FAM156B-like [Peromyscus californicus insignis]|uniref:protein FAM156A/FAM156B-like n=1 Tax=Peromyscus californicus insignis TaxID=564181 RepID=UPI0022A676FB|nr:protein FAM156A/FAM156B-like [Peromyscus californicus insignis]XP_052609947.1 protein FAM156A/FAM156B-like [Peromyscus californicus insignis]XP_052610033.1 protein FAM156A/FAM156B-like [Peromyscus californicus insignis]XP_052610109.1 protein FAM156A/FAM156B-like [Peromyscus californicus insignis]XP_052610196.1 protein FAM156A/FAM156B-like [Peromyscus californicus insignis]XP_052610285.1 protein FAM156A/FAM156B-like [Peromyscus californicus insignis]XP_052610370.1 protein FAM156A/FAM156B-li